jgi:hypothetical protein
LDGIFCNNCGAKLDEAPTLLPDQRPPCPQCGSLARRFEQTITGSATIARAEPATLSFTAHDATVGVQAHAGVAEGVGEAFDATVNAHGIPSADHMGDATVIRGPRIIRDDLVVQGRSLWWTQLTEDGGWLLQVVDEAGEEIADWGGYDPVEGLAAVAKFILPGHPG